MRIDSASANKLNPQEEIQQNKLSKTQEQLATGKKTYRASEAAAASAVSQPTDQYLQGNQNVTENIHAAISAAKVAAGGNSATLNMLQRQRDLTLESANGTLTSDQRQALNQAYQQLSQAIENISESADVTPQPSLNGHAPVGDGTGKIPQNQSTQGSVSNQFEFPNEDISTDSVNATQSSTGILTVNAAQTLTDKVTQSLVSDTQTAAQAQFDNLSRTHLLALLVG